MTINRWIILFAVATISARAFAEPDYGVDASDGAWAWTSNDPDNQAITDTSQATGPVDQHTSDSGFIAQTATGTGDNAESVLVLAGSIASPIGDGSSLPVNWQATGRSNATDTAGLGALHAYADATQTLSPFSESYVQTAGDGNTQSKSEINPLVATASADAEAQSQDLLTVESATLPYPSIVQIRLTLSVDSQESAAGQGPFGNASAIVTAGAYCKINYQSSNSTTPALNFNSDINGSAGTLSEVFDVYVGSSIYLDQSAEARANASSYVGPDYPLSAKPPVSNAVADASDTANFYLDVLDPQASLVSESGHDYSLPEPSVLCMAAGVVLLNPWRRSRR